MQPLLPGSPTHPASLVAGPTRAQQLAREALSAILVLLGLWTLHPFLPALVWAAVFAIAIWPAYRRVTTRFPPRGHNILVPLLFALAIALVFIVPLVLVAIQVSREAHDFLLLVRDAQANGMPVPDWVARLPFGADALAAWWRENLAPPGASGELVGHLNRGDVLTFTRAFGAQLLHRTILFGFTVLIVFFLFRDGEALTRQMLVASQRLFGPRGERIARQMVASVHGTVDGLVLVGLGVGVLLGIVYALTGVPHPALLGALTAIAAMIPFGAPLIFCLAGLLLLVQGALWGAAIVVTIGFVAVFVADHFVRPVLIGGSTRLPFVWVLLGILGGVETWGLLGLFLGPAIMAALMLLWRELSNPQVVEEEGQ